MFRLATGALLSFTMAAVGMASEPAGLPPGSRLRVGSSTGALVGTLVSWEADALVLDAGQGEPRRIPLAAVSKVELSRGKRSNAGRGAVIGAAVGAVPGLLVGWGDSPEHENQRPVVVGAIGAAAGAGIGAAIGWAAKTEKWEAVETARFRAGLVPLRGGAELSLTVTWRDGLSPWSRRARTRE